MANESPDPVTLTPSVQSAVGDGLTRNVIDTEGHADGNSMSSEQIQTLALFLRKWSKGVNGVCVILNGQSDRFSQGIKDTLQWACSTFAVMGFRNPIAKGKNGVSRPCSTVPV
jgi:hypothetical protein